MSRSLLMRRLVALVLSWVVPATSAWAVAPPIVVAGGGAPLAALSVVPGLAAALERSALEAHDGPSDGDRREQDKDRDRDRDDNGRGKSGSRGRPILLRCECVEDEGDGTYTAHFGYESQNAEALTIKAGADNQVTPAPNRRDQPTRFLPGRSRGWPESAFRLRFDGKPVTWTLKGPDGVVQRATAALHLPRCGGNPPACENPFWGPKRFEVKARVEHDDRDRDDKRDKDWDDRDHRGHRHKAGDKCDRDDDDDSHKRPTVYEETITLPAGIAPPYRLTVVNGDAGLQHRVLLGSIFVDGRLVIGPLHLNPLVRQVTREVALKPVSRLKLRLVGLPGSYVTLSICGSSAADTTPPAIAIADPAVGALIGDTTPSLRVTYSDPAGPGAASGVDPATLVVTLDGQDKTAWFAKSASEATAEVPADAVLAEGGHRLEARIRDAAGNEAAATPVEFRVDSLPPQVAITQPQDGTFTSAATADVSGTVADASAIVRLRVNGQDATLAGGSFTAAGIPIGDGPEVTIEAEAEDAAGNLGHATVRLRVDRRSPMVTITHPADGDTVQGPVIEVEGTVDDDGDVRVEVNGTPEDAPPSLRAPRSFVAHVPITDGTTALRGHRARRRGQRRHDARDGADRHRAAHDRRPRARIRSRHEGDERPRGRDGHGRLRHRLGDGGRPAGDRRLGRLVRGGRAARRRRCPGDRGGSGRRRGKHQSTDHDRRHHRPHAAAGVHDREPRGRCAARVAAGPGPGHCRGSAPRARDGRRRHGHGHGPRVAGARRRPRRRPAQLQRRGARPRRERDAPDAQRAARHRLPGRDDHVAVRRVAAARGKRDGHGQRARRDAAVARASTASLAGVTGDAASPEGATFTLASLPLAEGGNVVEAVAEDGLARHGSAQVNVVRDSQAPVVELSAPSLLVRGRDEKAIASASDGAGSGVASLVFLIDGQPVATLGQPPFEIPLEAPATLASGQSFTVAAQATDLAGNVGALVSRAVRVVSEGVVVGQVLADETSLPAAGRERPARRRRGRAVHDRRARPLHAARAVGLGARARRGREPHVRRAGAAGVGRARGRCRWTPGSRRSRLP